MRFFKSKAGKIVIWVVVSIMGLMVGVLGCAWMYLTYLSNKSDYIDSEVALTAKIKGENGEDLDMNVSEAIASDTRFTTTKKMHEEDSSLSVSTADPLNIPTAVSEVLLT